MAAIVLNHSDVKEFECSICNELYGKEIFQCIKGHSICASCNTKLAQCPFCESPIGGTRNYALETFVEKIQVKCKHEQCSSKVKLSKYAEHLSLKCAFRQPACKLCADSASSYEDINEHIRQKHKQFVIDNGSIPQSHQLTVSCLEWYTKMFWIKRFIEDGNMYWYAQATARIGDNQTYYLSVAALKPNGIQSRIDLPCFLDPMESDVNMRNQISVGFKKSKLSGCKFHVSVAKKDENLALVKSVFSPHSK